MANIQGMLSYRIRDDSSVVANKSIFFIFADTVTLAGVQAFANAYAALLDAITEGVIVKQVFRAILPTSGLKDTPVADSDVEETLLTSYEQATSPYTWGDDVPAIIQAAIVNGRVDLTNADVAAYTAFLVAAHSGIANTSSDYIDLIALDSGQATFRKHRKQLNARSKSFA